jgi:hypothetical protein
LSEVARDDLGLPKFVLSGRFDRELLDALGKTSIEHAISCYVSARRGLRHRIPHGLLTLYAVADCHYDTNNGTFDQYFARQKDLNGCYQRSELYALVYEGLQRCGLTDFAALFAQAIALYASKRGRVERTRKEPKIPSVDHSFGARRLLSRFVNFYIEEKEDLRQDYYKLERGLDSAMTEYVRGNFDEVMR